MDLSLNYFSYFFAWRATVKNSILTQTEALDQFYYGFQK